MKNTLYLFTLLFISLILSCNQDNDCNGAASLTAVLPNSNSPGYEVQIIGEGLTVNPEIRFGGQLAKTDFSAEKGLIAVVPDKIIGLVDLTIEAGDCLLRTDFEVLGALPGSVVTSPTVIILPALPSSFPSNLTNQSATWVNFYDRNYSLSLYQNESCRNVTDPPVKFEAFENHTTNNFLNNNPVNATYNCKNGVLELKIDRTSKGGKIETWQGYVVRYDAIGLSKEAAEGKAFLLLTEKVTKRQAVFFSSL